MRQPARWILIPVLLGLFACGDDGEGALPVPTATHTSVPPTATRTATFTSLPTVTVTPVPEGAMALFSSDGLSVDNPFPSDRLRGEDGHVRATGAFLSTGLPPDPRYDAARGYFDVIAEQISTLTGFSTFAPMRVRFDGPVEAIQANDPPGVLVVRYDDPSIAVPVRVTAVTPDVSGDDALEIQPLVPLEPKTRYVYVVTTAVRDAAGHPVHGSSALARALNGEDETLTEWRAQLLPVLAELSDERGIALTDIAAIDFFTTQPTTDDLVSIQGLLHDGTLPPPAPVFENSPVPGLVTGVFPEGSPEFATLVGSATSDTLAAVAVGSFDSFDFRFGNQMAFDPARVSGEVTPTVNHLDFYLTIPKAAPPPEGYPITIFGHGLGGSGTDAINIGKAFGGAPMMVIGISDVEHGRRGTMMNFFNLVEVFATRENFRQTIADYMQLEQMIRTTDVPPFDQVDKSRVQYMGVSLGGIMGTLFMGVEPDVRVGMLSVPGGGLPSIIQSDAIGDLIEPLLALVTAVPRTDPFFPILVHRFTEFAQWVLDAGDPVNMAPYVIDPERRLPGVPAKRILMHEGIADSVVPNATTENLARAMGLPDVKATGGCTDPAGCSGIWRYVMTEYGFAPDSGHGVTFQVPQATQQATHFVLSDGTEIIDASPAP